MKKVQFVLSVAIVLLVACVPDTPNVEQGEETATDVRGNYAHSLPENYMGITEFQGLHQKLSVYDASDIVESHIIDSDGGTFTSYRVEYDFCWVRDIASDDRYKYEQVRAGDSFNGYKVKEAKIGFEDQNGYTTLSTVVFEGDVIMRGDVSISSLGSDVLAFKAYEHDNDFLPMMWIGDGMFFTIYEGFDSSLLEKLQDVESLAVEMSVSELSLIHDSNETSTNICIISGIEVITSQE